MHAICGCVCAHAIMQCNAVDDVGDMDVNTGPCHSGTRRFIGKHADSASTATVHEADVVLISASGNHVGHMVSELELVTLKIVLLLLVQSVSMYSYSICSLCVK